MTCRCDLGRMTGKACHCRTCCITFSGPWAFDQHLVGWSTRQGAHKRPEDAGLVEIRPGVWGSPDSGRRVLRRASS